MKNYKDFGKTYIGASDYASLILVGCGDGTEMGLRLHELHFGGDGGYNACIIDEEDVEIGKHYKKVFTAYHWMKIYDDTGLAKEYKADVIEVYRAGGFGCIIKLIVSDRERELKIKILSYVGLIDSENMEDWEIDGVIKRECEGDYLTECTGRDGINYLWYLDESKEAHLNLETGEIVNFDEEDIERLFL